MAICERHHSQWLISCSHGRESLWMEETTFCVVAAQSELGNLIRISAETEQRQLDWIEFSLYLFDFCEQTTWLDLKECLLS